MKISLLAVLTVPAVIAFGAGTKPNATEATSTVLDACLSCVCKNTQVDPESGTKKCCAKPESTSLPIEWDDFCDALTLDECSKECIGADGMVTLSKTKTSVRGRGTRQAGSICDSRFRNTDCGPGLDCVSVSGAAYRFCQQSQQVPFQQSDLQYMTSGGDPVAIAQKLKAKGVQLLAWDWDRTANDHHTFQKTYANYDQIAESISPDFVASATAWCNDNSPQAIVTYNDMNAKNRIAGQSVRGPDMIRQVLGMVLPPSCAAAMPIYARNFDAEGDTTSGKNPLIQQAQTRFGVPSNQAVMLFDDTTNNIVQAKPQGYQTAEVTPKSGFRFFNLGAGF